MTDTNDGRLADVFATTVRETALVRVDDALYRMLMKGEAVARFDVTLTMGPGPSGGVVPWLYLYIELERSNPVIGAPNLWFYTSQPGPPQATTSQEVIDGMVRGALEAIRARRADLLKTSNGKP